MNTDKIKALAAQMAPHAVELRRQIHQHPEIAYQEVKTSALVMAELERLGIEHYRIGDTTAVVGIVRGDKPGATVGIRADMDALPLQEKTGLPFASKCDGVMHACGHDAHTAILMGTAAVLQALKGEMRGNVKLFFQPAEEGDGGAKPMIAAGCMENPHVDEVYGLHVGGEAVGKVGAKAGVINAFSDDFTVTIRGRKSHGARPERGVDAVYVAAQVINAIHGLPSRRVSATDSVSINVGAIHGGVVHNIICDEVEMKIMFRSLSRETRERVIAEMCDIINGVCTAHRAEADIQRHMCYESQVNEGYLVDRVRELSAQLLGDDSFVEGKLPSLGTEDFCFFGQAAPSVFYNLGSGSAPGHQRAPGHSSEFTINEDCIEVGIAMHTALAIDGLERLGK